MSIVEQLSSKRLCFSVTSGRSGTKLLATLLRKSAKLCAQHEPAPRYNYVLRSILDCPEAAGWWLQGEKLPAVAQMLGAGHAYAELSHLTCKGFIEPLLDLGLRPVFIILSRPAREVAASLFKIGAVPERTSSGRLVLIGPRHSSFLALTGWEGWTDYQLCYWYARENRAPADPLSVLVWLAWNQEMAVDCSFAEIAGWSKFLEISAFVAGGAVEADRSAFDLIAGHNQNARQALLNGAPEANLPDDLDAQEQEIDALIAELDHLRAGRNAC